MAAAAVFDLDALPQELLERVLAWLPIADLVALRAVSRRWRAAIAQLAAADAPFAFECGWPDWNKNAPWPEQERARLLATPRDDGRMRTEEEVESEVYELVMELLNQLVCLPCSCGAAQLVNYREDDFALGLLHDESLYPARYALLAPERALAFKVSAVAMALFRHISIADREHFRYEGGGGCTNEWLPIWFYLPTDVQRPRSTLEVHCLAQALMDERVSPGEQPLLAKLADPAFARSFYAAGPQQTFRTYGQPLEGDDASKGFDWENPASWKEVTCPEAARGPLAASDVEEFEYYEVSLSELIVRTIWLECPLFEKASMRTCALDASNLETLRLKARQSAASWRIIHALKWMRWLQHYSELNGFDQFEWRLRKYGVDMTGAAIQRYLDSQVAATDHAVAEIKRMLRHAVASTDGSYGGPLWVLGLSPGGHLVGAVTDFYGAG